MQTIKPHNNQIFAKPSEGIKQTKTGLILSDEIDKPTTAEVINVGSRVKDIKSGDVISYKPYAASEVKLNSTDYILVADEDVLGVVIEVPNET